jgi:hypothetical protein
MLGDCNMDAIIGIDKTNDAKRFQKKLVLRIERRIFSLQVKCFTTKPYELVNLLL